MTNREPAASKSCPSAAKLAASQQRLASPGPSLDAGDPDQTNTGTTALPLRIAAVSAALSVRRRSDRIHQIVGVLMPENNAVRDLDYRDIKG